MQSINQSINQSEQAAKAQSSSLARLAASPTPGSSGTPEPGTPNATAAIEVAFNISPEECIRRLRQKSQPIRLFGETDKDRRLRLRALELLQERGASSGVGNQYDWKKALEDMETTMEAREVAKKAREAHLGHLGHGHGGMEGKREMTQAEREANDGILDLALIKTDPNRLYPLIYYALKVGPVYLLGHPFLSSSSSSLKF